MSTFWGAKIEKGKKFTQNVEESYHLTMACLDLSEGSKGKDKPVTLFVETDKNQHVLCNLDYKNTFQQPLDLVFTEGQDVAFFTKGEGIVHLTGYLLPPEDDFEEGIFDEELSGEDEEEMVAELENGMGDVSKKEKVVDVQQQLKRKIAEKAGDNKKQKVEEKKKGENKSNELAKNSDTKKVEIKEVPKKIVTKMEDSDNEEMSSEDDDSENFADLMGNDIDEEDEEEEEDEDEEDSDENEDKDDIHKMKNFQNKMKKNLEEAKGKQNKQMGENKKDVQVKKPFQAGFQQKTPQQSGFQQKSPQSGFQNKKDFTPKQNKSFNQQKGGTPYKKPDAKSNSDLMKKLPSGLQLNDVIVGNGPIAKKGKMVYVNYVGKLQYNNKEFDRTTKKPFAFRLGCDEVIKGWEQGIEGMKVGTKRKLIIPPSLGYGKQKFGPIPPNSTLVFDIELKAIS